MIEKFNKPGIMLVLSVIFLLASCGTPDEKKMVFFSKGNSLFEAGDYVKARLEFKNAVQIDPKFAQGYYMLGKTELSLGDGKKAFGFISKAVQLDPGLIDGRLDLGKMFLSGRALERAMEQADEILKIDPDNVDARILKAGVYFSEKKFEKAGDMLDIIESAGMKKAEFYLLQASYYKATEKNKMAGDVLNKGMKEHPESLALIMALAKYHGQEGDLKGVETYLKKAIEITPENIGLKLNLARLYIETQKQDEARIILNKIIEADHENEKNTMAVAVLLIRSGELDQGIEIVEKGIEKTPANYGYSALLSEIYLKKKEIKKAEDVLRKFLSLEDQLSKPDMIKVKINLANLLLLEKRTSDAEILIDQVLEDDPKNIDAHRLKGKMYLVSGDGPGAVAKFRAVISENPGDIEGLIGLANAYALSRDYGLSLDILSNALKTLPDSVKLLKARIRVNVMKKDTAAVEADLKEIIRLEPDNLDSIASLGDFYLSLNRHEDALAQYDFIKNKKPDVPLGYLKTALAFARQNKINKAIEELETGSKKSPQSSVFATSIAQLYLKQGKKQAAIEKFRDALDLDPKNTFAWLTLANIYELSRENEKAMAVYREFLTHFPDSWSAANNLAFLLTEKGQSKASLEEAMTLAQKAETLNPGSPLVQDTMGWIYYKKGDLAKAEDKISQAIEKMPDNDVICYHFGVICHDLGKGLEAEVNLKKALAGDNEFLGRQYGAMLYEKYYKR